MALAIVSKAVAVLKGLDILKKWFLPDKKHEEILRRFQQLSTQIGQVTAQIKSLETLIKWELTGLQYADVVQRIKLGMEFCHGIGKGIGQAEKDNQDRLKDLCSNQNITLALDALLDGITGDGLFRKSILDNLYDQTNGDRQKIISLTNRLEQLVCGGMIVLATYETLMRGVEGAKAMTVRYSSRLKEVSVKIDSVIGGCVGNFEGNMVSDLNESLDKGGSNESIVTRLSRDMHDKYDWLENFCLVYNDLHGFDQHCFNGYRADSLHRNGKCGIVFYRPKDEPPRFSNRYDEARMIVNDSVMAIDGSWFPNAQDCHKTIVARLRERSIGWTGCSVTTRNPDLRVAGTFSTKIISVVGQNVAAILMLQ